MRISQICCAAAISMVLLAIFCRVSRSQATAATVSGEVTDPQGKAVPGGTVVFTNVNTGVSSTTRTNGDGIYNLPTLQPGIYRANVAKDGFKSIVKGEIELHVQDQVSINFALELGSVSETVTVSGGASLVNTQTTEVGTLIGTRSITELPLSSRNAIQLATLAPGVGFAQIHVAMAGWAEYASVAGASNSSRLGVNGNTPVMGEYLLDGTEFSGPYYNSGIDYPNPDALQEFRFVTSNYSAEFGKNPGGIMNVVTKSGTNQIHGGAWEFNRNSAVGARLFFNPTNPFLNQNQFGFDVGGPIKKDKVFAFGTGQWFRIAQNRSSTSGLPPTTVERQGNLSDPKLHPKQIVNPSTGLPFAGNIIPAANLDPMAQKLLNFIQLPTTSNGLWVGAVSEPVYNYQWMTKVDYNMSDRNRLTGSFYDDQTSSTSLLDFGADQVPLNPQAVTGTLPKVSTSLIRDLILSDTFSIRPTLINQFRFAYVLFNGDVHAINRGPTYSQLGANFPVLPDQDIPGVAITGRVNNGSGQFILSDSHDDQFADSVNYIRGGHDLRIGGEVRFRTFAFRSTGTNPGQITCTGDYSGDATADLLLGRCNLTMTTGQFSEATQNSFAAYFQDNYKVSRRLVLNIGLRYERYSPWTDKKTAQLSSGTFVAPTGTLSIANIYSGTRSSVFPTAPPGLVYPGDPGVPASIAPTNPKFEPRVGLAWDVFGNGKTSLRAGWGWFTTTPYGWSSYVGAQMPPFLLRALVYETPSLTNPIPAATAAAFPPKLGPTLDFTPFGSIGTQTIPTDFKNGDVQQFNLTIQKELPGRLSVSAAYVGNVTTHLMYDTDYNTSVFIPGTDPVTGQPYSTVANDFSRGRLNLALHAAGFVAPDYNPYGYAYNEQGRSNSNYHSLQLTVRKELSHGLNSLTAYTWGKAIDFGGSGGNAYTTDGGFAQDITCLKCERGLSRMDMRHKFVQSLVYTTPEISQRLLGTKSRAARYAFDSWEFSGIGTLASGLPFDVTLGVDNSRSNNYADRPNPVGNPNLSMSRPRGQKLAQYYNPQAFVFPAVGQFGSFGRDVLIGPGQANVDFAGSKNLAISERWGTLQLRFESFNFLNRPYFSFPVHSLSAANAGTITSVAGIARQIQFGVKYTF